MHGRHHAFRDTGSMDGDRAGELLEYVRDLDRRDADLAAQIGVAGDLLHRVDGVRASAERVARALAMLPAEVDRATQAVADAKVREADARREAEVAERALAEALASKRVGDEARSAAERAFRRASVHAEDTAGLVARQEERLQVLRSERIVLRAETDRLVVEAETVARDVVDLPRLSASGRSAPGASLPEIEEWGARAHAAIFVVRGGLETERERLVLEANALAAAHLGDHGGAASVALVRTWLEMELR